MTKPGTQDAGTTPLSNGKIGQTLRTLLHEIPTEQPDMNEADGEILTLEEVAAYLKAGKKTVCRLARQSQIPCFKPSGTWRFRRTEPDHWIAAQIAQKTKEKP